MPELLRFGSFNLLSGRSLDDGRVLPARLSEAVGALDVDVLAVQEVDRGQARSGGTDQLALVADACGAQAGAFAPSLWGAPGPGRAWRVAGGDPVMWSPGGAPGAGPAYGVGLVSRWPVLAWRVLRFAAARGVLPLLVPGSDGRARFLLVPEEPRVALAAVVQTPRGPVTVVSTHLSFMPLAAARQLRAITRWAATLPAPRLLLGDLNLVGPLPALLTGWQRLAKVATFPSSRPRVQLDHALGDGWGGGLATVSTPQVAISDHRPLVVHLS